MSCIFNYRLYGSWLCKRSWLEKKKVHEGLLIYLDFGKLLHALGLGAMLLPHIDVWPHLQGYVSHTLLWDKEYLLEQRIFSLISGPLCSKRRLLIALSMIRVEYVTASKVARSNCLCWLMSLVSCKREWLSSILILFQAFILRRMPLIMLMSLFPDWWDRGLTTRSPKRK